MRNELARLERAELATSVLRAKQYANASSAENTKKAYRNDWAVFTGWCEARGLAALPAEPATVAAFIAEQADRLKVSTLERRMVAISQAHKLAGYESPTQLEIVRRVLKGIKREKGTVQTQKQAATTDVLKRMVEALDESLAGTRNRALLLIGFAGAFRRSELVALEVSDLLFSPQGVVITVRKSKTDQEGQGQKKAIPYGLIPATCPVRALERWLRDSGITSGPIFRRVYPNGTLGKQGLSGNAVALLVKEAAERAGLDAATFAGHSLRAGLATSAAAAGVEERDIMKQTGHKSERVLRRYIREGQLFSNNAAGRVGL